MYKPGGGGENVESAALGVLILWTTWFGFNAGSTESISGAYSKVSNWSLFIYVFCIYMHIILNFIYDFVFIMWRVALICWTVVW